MRLLNATTLITNRGILGVLFFRMLLVWKRWHSGSTIFQNVSCLEIMAFWKYCKWKLAKLEYNVKFHFFLGTLGRKCRPRARVPRKKVEFWPKMSGEVGWWYLSFTVRKYKSLRILISSSPKFLNKLWSTFTSFSRFSFIGGGGGGLSALTEILQAGERYGLSCVGSNLMSR